MLNVAQCPNFLVDEEPGSSAGPHLHFPQFAAMFASVRSDIRGHYSIVGNCSDFIGVMNLS